MVESDLPLTGVRIIDCVEGPLQSVGRLLADLGAEVVRVEPPGGSPARKRGLQHGGISLTFLAQNANKVSVSADAAQPDGHRRIAELLSTADILLADWSAGEQARYGFSEAELKRINPRLVSAFLSDFGRTGPRKDWKGTPDVLFAVSSVLSRSGLPEVDEPLLPPEFLAYESAAVQAAWAVMLGYVQSLATGSGECIDFSAVDALVQILDPVLGVGGSARGGAPITDLPSGRPDARHLYPIFATTDGWVRICVLNARQWRGMFGWLGEPAEFADEKYNTTSTRFQVTSTLYPMIGSLLASLTSDEAVREGQSRGIPVAELVRASKVIHNPAFIEAGSFSSLHLPDGSTATIPTGVFEIDDARAGIRFPIAAADSGNEVSIARDRLSAAVGVGSRPFEGLRVLDLGVIVVGAELGRLFADYGADVIKVESREFPDGSRGSHDGSEITNGFAWGHRNKRSLGLNLKSEQGKKIFAELVERSDIVLANFKPGTLQSLGLDYDTLAAINPRIILSESSAFGNHGPWSTRMGYGPLVRASAGMSSLWSYPEIEGSFSDAITIFPDHLVGRLNAIAVTALLLRRARTGLGGHVSTAQVDAIFSGMADQFALESLEPGSIQNTGNDRGKDAPRGIFPAAGDDNWLVVDVTTDEQFANLAVTVGHPEWRDDARFRTSDARLSNRSELVAALTAWTRSRAAGVAATLLQEAGVPAGHMVRAAELLEDAHLLARGVFGTMTHSQLPEPFPTNLGEARFSSVPQPLLADAPRQAEHTYEVLADVLSLDANAVDDLLASGAVQVHPAIAELREDYKKEREDARHES
ncbi:MAG: hypothetical protein JWQ19_3576 [Subtercola sp.]|nr:hypothetical protein [Subtercola sp.]